MSKKTKKPKKTESDYIDCPCCGKRRKIQTQTPLIAVQERFSNNWLCRGDWAVRDAKTRRIKWACNDCLSSGSVIEGKPEKQHFTDYMPYLAYIDRDYICEDCHNAFVFSAQEQQYWYEELWFWVQSRPKQCLPCRRKRHAKRAAMQDLQKELAHLDHNDPRQLLHVATLYVQLDLPHKAREYLARAVNCAHRRGEDETFAQQIELLQRQIENT